jgi:riboflavin synthase
MFTGLIEALGEIRESKPTSAGLRLRIATDLAREIAAGDSVAVNGVCLTAIAVGEGELHADAGPETLRVTTLGALERGALVNLERPLRADQRLGGHFVQGHVDAPGTLDDVRPEAEFRWMTFAFPSLLGAYIVRKGSIAVDGISLTVAGIGENRFDVQIVPFTWEHTNLKSLRVRDRVNLECDILGKYVVRAVEVMGLGGRGPQKLE